MKRVWRWFQTNTFCSSVYLFWSVTLNSAANKLIFGSDTKLIVHTIKSFYPLNSHLIWMNRVFVFKSGLTFVKFLMWKCISVLTLILSKFINANLPVICFIGLNLSLPFPLINKLIHFLFNLQAKSMHTFR